MPTTEELDELKRYWLEDPFYDLEDADGFEEHVEELRAFRLEQEDRWRVEREARLKARAEELGIADNPALAAYILQLEARVEALESLAQRLSS